MALNLLIFGDNRTFEDILKLVCGILKKKKNLFQVKLVQPLKLGKTLDKTTKLTGPFLCINFFFGGFEFILFCWRFLIKVEKGDLIQVAIYIYFYDLRTLTQVSLNWDVKKSHRRIGVMERVGWLVTLELMWDQSHLIPHSSHQAPKSYFAYTL